MTSLKNQTLPLLLFTLAALLPAEEITVTRIAEKVGTRTDLRPIPVGFHAPEVNKTFITWMGENSNAYVKALDHATGLWTTNTLVGRSTFADKHNYPGMLRGKDNRIYIFYGCHNSTMRMAVSPDPLSIDGAWTDVDIKEAERASYPAPVITDEGHFYVFYRDTRKNNDHADDRPYQYVVSKDNGKTWTRHMAIDPYPREDNYTEVYNGMVNYEPARNGHQGRIHMAWTFCGGGVGRHAHATYGQCAYYAYLDVASGKLFNVAGADLGETINNEEAQGKCLVFDGGTGRDSNHLAGLQVSAHWRDNGHPFLHFQRAGSGLGSSTWDGSQWVHTSIPEARGEPRWIEKLTGDSFRIYNPSGRNVKVYKTEDAGATWVLESTIDAGQNIDRCLVINDYHPSAKLLMLGGGTGNIRQPSRDLLIGSVKN